MIHVLSIAYHGNGQNGNPEQNTFFRMIFKAGWSGSNLPLGFTIEFQQNYSNQYKFGMIFTNGNYTNIADIYIYLPFNYNDFLGVYHGMENVCMFYSDHYISGTQTLSKNGTVYNISP